MATANPRDVLTDVVNLNEYVGRLRRDLDELLRHVGTDPTMEQMLDHRTNGAFTPLLLHVLAEASCIAQWADDVATVEEPDTEEVHA